MNALDNPSLLQLSFRDPADAVGAEIGISGLDAAQTAEVFIPRLLPLGDQILIGDFLIETEVI